MELPDPEALVTISPQIPWYFIVALVVAAIVIVLLIVKAVAYGLAAGHDRRARQEGKHHPGRRPSGGTLTAVVLAALGAVIVGVNYQAIWYFANPELSSPAENELSVREQLAEQGAESLTLRATDPLHSLQRIDEEAWNDDLPLEALLVCDMGQTIGTPGHCPCHTHCPMMINREAPSWSATSRAKRVCSPCGMRTTKAPRAVTASARRPGVRHEPLPTIAVSPWSSR